jgi:hypothetical protein
VRIVDDPHFREVQARLMRILEQDAQRDIRHDAA